MKLLLYSHFFAPSVGGVETITLSLARGLADLRSAEAVREFEVTVATVTPAGAFDDSTLPFRIFRNPGFLQLRRLIHDADVLHVAGPSLLPLALAWLAGKPVALEHHGYQSICPNGVLVHQPDASICPGHFQSGRYSKCFACQSHEVSRFPALKNLLFMFPRHFFSRRVAANVAISHHVQTRHALPRTSVIYYGIDDLLAAAPASVKAPTGGKICFAYVGRIVPEKGLPVLLDAAAVLRRAGRDFNVLLIGDGPERPRIEALIEQKKLGDCVRITGYLTGDALAAQLAGVHAVVMPSAWEETAGLAAIEQMMRGRPVIASRIGGLGEVVAHAGLLCTPGDSGELAQAMLRVLGDPSLIPVLGAQARARALQLFLRPRMIAEHAAVYRSLLDVLSP